MTPLIEQELSCRRCEAELRYVGNGEWHCECGEQELADWLDGPAFVDWLNVACDNPEWESNWPSLAKRMRDWRKGGQVNIYTADRYLVQLGLHVCDLPDALWRNPPERGRPVKRVSAKDKRAALKRIANGETVAATALSLGVTPRAITYWREKQAVAA